MFFSWWKQINPNHLIVEFTGHNLIVRGNANNSWFAELLYNNGIVAFIVAISTGIFSFFMKSNDPYLLTLVVVTCFLSILFRKSLISSNLTWKDFLTKPLAQLSTNALKTAILGFFWLGFGGGLSFAVYCLSIFAFDGFYTFVEALSCSFGYFYILFVIRYLYFICTEYRAEELKDDQNFQVWVLFLVVLPLIALEFLYSPIPNLTIWFDGTVQLGVFVFYEAGKEFAKQYGTVIGVVGGLGTLWWRSVGHPEDAKNQAFIASQTVNPHASVEQRQMAVDLMRAGDPYTGGSLNSRMEVAKFLKETRRQCAHMPVEEIPLYTSPRMAELLKGIQKNDDGLKAICKKDLPNPFNLDIANSFSYSSSKMKSRFCLVKRVPLK